MAFTKEPSKEMKRRILLIRGLSSRNVSQEEYDKEMVILDPIIKKQTADNLKEAYELRGQVKEEIRTSQYDGNLKRAIADLLYQFLEESLSDEEIKGVFRQGYKLMRQKC